MASLKEIYGSAQEAKRSDLNWYNDMDDCWEYEMDYTKAGRVLDKRHFLDWELEGRYDLRKGAYDDYAYTYWNDDRIA